MSAYNEIKDCLYPELQRIRNENDYGYKQLFESANQAIHVGPMIDGQEIQLSASQNPTALTTYEKWGYMDDANTCIYNAQKMYTNMLLNENIKIAKGEISVSSGVLTKTVSLARVSDFNVGIFDDINSSEEHGLIDVPANTAVDYFTYFCPNESGTHTFQVSLLEVYYLWIKNDYALYDYLPRNSDINKESINVTAGAKFVKVDLKKGEYYPLRIQLYSGSSGSSIPVYIYDPQGKSIYDTTGHNYFNVLDNGNYIRKMLYYALYKPQQSMTNYKCYFLYMTPNNYKNIKRMKMNQPILYKKLIIPTPITYESYIYSESAGEGTQLQMKCPVGGKITVVNATWGTNEIRINEPSYETRTHTDPNIIIDNNSVTYEWTTPNADLVTYTHHTPTYNNGFAFEKFEGNSNGNPDWYNGKYYINQTNQPPDPGTHNFPTEYNMNYESNSDMSVRMTGNIYAAHGGGHDNNWPGTVLVFQLESSHGCVARLQIYDRVYTSNGNRVGDDNKHNLVGIPWNTAVPITLWSSPGQVWVHVKRWGRRGGRNRRWRGKSDWTDMKGAMEHKWITANHSFYTVTRIPQADTLNAADITTKTYLDPTPTYQVELPNLVTYKGDVDLTQQIQQIVNTGSIKTEENGFEVHTLDGNYETPYTPLLPNIVAKAQLNKQLIIHYKFEIDLTGNDVTNKQLYVDETGQFVISYDYNGETSTFPIAPALNQNQMCLDDKPCNYTLTLEDDASLTTKSGSGVVISRSLRQELDVALGELGLTFDDIITNFTWKNDPINIYSTLNNGDLLTNEIVELEPPLKVHKSIRSDNGKFKLAFEGTDLCIYYCVPSYDTKEGIDYTSNIHSAIYANEPAQYFYLYRPKANPLAGHIVATQHNTTAGFKDLKIVPFSHNQILIDGSVNTVNGVYPVICDSLDDTCDANVNFASLGPPVDVPNNTKVKFASLGPVTGGPNYFYFDVSNIEQCSDACLSEPNCQHFFHINTSTGIQKCLRDNKANPNPLTTYNNPDPEYISTSSVNMRTYTINDQDPDCYIGKEISQEPTKDFSNYITLYNADVSNNVNKIGLCGDSSYNQISDYINSANGFFSGGDPYISRPDWLQCGTTEQFTNFKTYESFDGTCGTAQCLVDELDRIGATRAAEFNEKQEKVGVMEEKIDKEYTDLGVNVKKKDLKRIQKEIPSKYTKKLYSARPESTVLDARETDSNEIAIYENTLYTISTLTAATIIISAIILTRD